MTDLDVAVFLNCNLDVSSAADLAVAPDRDPAPDSRCLRVVVSGGLRGPAKRLFGANILPLFPGGVLIVGADDVAESEIERIHANGPCHDVHVRFACEVALHMAR